MEGKKKIQLLLPRLGSITYHPFSYRWKSWWNKGKKRKTRKDYSIYFSMFSTIIEQLLYTSRKHKL